MESSGRSVEGDSLQGHCPLSLTASLSQAAQRGRKRGKKGEEERRCVGESVVKLRAQSHPNSALPLHPGASDPEHDRTSVTLSRAKHTSRLGMTVLARLEHHLVFGDRARFSGLCLPSASRRERAGNSRAEPEKSTHRRNVSVRDADHLSVHALSRCDHVGVHARSSSKTRFRAKRLREEGRGMIRLVMAMAERAEREPHHRHPVSVTSYRQRDRETETQRAIHTGTCEPTQAHAQAQAQAQAKTKNGPGRTERDAASRGEHAVLHLHVHRVAGTTAPTHSAPDVA
eukprot:2770228-Rhodomonas_salina.1